MTATKQIELTGQEKTILATLSQLGSPYSPRYLAERCWARKRRLPQKEKIIRRALAKFRRMGLVTTGPSRRMDPRSGQWVSDFMGWIATDEGQRMGQGINYERRISNPHDARK